MIPSLIRSGLAIAGVSALVASSGVTQEQLGWGRATQVLQESAAANGALGSAIAEWRSLQQPGTQDFESYARFLLAHPGWPGELAIRRSAEKSLAAGNWSPGTVTSFFRRYPPLTGTGGARFAEALAASGARDEAALAARKAWVSGPLAPADETALLTNFPGALTIADQDARMDALLWAGALPAAARQIALVGGPRRAVFEARLAFRSGAEDASARSLATEATGAGDPGYIADRAVWLRDLGAAPSARSWLARPHALLAPPGSVERWYEVLLTNAREAAADGQYQLAYDIARQVDDAYPIGTDVSAQPYGERDDYTSLVWLAGQAAMKRLARPGDAVGLFDRYARGSKTPQTRSKGLYWAARAAEAAGRQSDATAYLTRAAGYRDLYYGQLATERLGRALMPPGQAAARTIDPLLRRAFYARETVRAAQYLGTTGDWESQTAFVRQIALDAKTDTDHSLATELSRALGRPDLGVMIGRSALQNGLTDYNAIGYPSVRVPASAEENWTIVHAIARQESQFDRAAISRVGARGLMQLMPATARETAGKLGLSYDSQALTSDTDYNIQLGSTYFQRIYNLYGSYPLAIAAYNAGPGNVNKWLRANGDPRLPGVDIVDWVEAIPLSETRNYVQRVLENAVVYDLMNPMRSRSTGGNRMSWYLGKQRPG